MLKSRMGKNVIGWTLGNADIACEKSMVQPFVDASEKGSSNSKLSYCSFSYIRGGRKDK